MTGATGTRDAGTASRGDGSERVADHLDLGSAPPSREHRDDVEAEGPRPDAVLPEPAGRERADAALLRDGHRLGGHPEAIAAAGLDLAEHDESVGADDEVELAVATAPVAVEHDVARRLVPS